MRDAHAKEKADLNRGLVETSTRLDQMNKTSTQMKLQATQWEQRFSALQQESREERVESDKLRSQCKDMQHQLAEAKASGRNLA